MTIEYAVIFVNFDPATDSDNISTRIELEPSSSLAGAVAQQYQLLHTISCKESYRSYIQERETYIQQVSTRKTVTRSRIKGITNIVEHTV